MVIAMFCLAVQGAAPVFAQVLNSPRALSEYASNTLFTAFSARSPKTLDPQRSYSTDETAYTYSIYEPLYQYNYLKRPYTLEPRTASALAHPKYLDKKGRELPDDALPTLIAESVYEINIQPGIFYAPHPAFVKDEEGHYRYHNLSYDDARRYRSVNDFEKVATRELVAEDYVWGIKRIASPRVVSPILGTMQGYIVGMDSYAEKLRQLDREQLGAGGSSSDFLDLNLAQISGVKAIGRYTLQIKIKGKYPQFSNWLTMAFFAPVPWEADRFYAQKGFIDNNFTLNTWPVGTGPYMMSVFMENRRHVMVKNPNFRYVPYPCEGEPGDREKGFLADCGKPLPLTERVVFDSEKEAVPLQTKFLQGYYDSPVIDRVDTGLGFLVAMGDSPEKAKLYREKKLQFPQTVESSFWYIGFNWLDPVVGKGASAKEEKRNRLLRQAISIALDWEENIAIFQKNQGIPAQGPIPPGLFGWQDDGPSAFNPVVYKKDAKGRIVRRSIEEARQLMREAGYPDGRDVKTGQPLVLSFDYQNASQGSKAYLEWYQRQFAKLGIQLDIRATDYNRFQDKMQKGSAQIFLWGWVADYPDAENFLFLFYGPNAKVSNGGENASNYQNKRFDEAFEAMKYLEDGPQKQVLINKMISIMQEDAPIMFGYFPMAAAAFQEWVTNAKPTSMVRNSLQYMGVNASLRCARIQEWNQPVLWPLFFIVAGLFGVIVFALRIWRRRNMVRLRPLSQANGGK